MRYHVQARVRVCPFTPGLYLNHGGHSDIIIKFCDAYSTRDRGRTLSLRSRLLSQGSGSRYSSSSHASSDRRVRFFEQHSGIIPIIILPLLLLVLPLPPLLLVPTYLPTYH